MSLTSQQPVFAILCNPQGQIVEVLRDDFGFSTPAAKERLWIALIDPSNLIKALNFLREISEKGAVYDWEMSALLNKETIPLHFAGGKINDLVLIVATATSEPSQLFTEEMGKILYEYANLLRAKMHTGAGADRTLFEEVSRLNYDLVNMQRELTRKNAELAEKQSLIQRIFETAPNVLMIFDLETRQAVFANREIVAILGYTPAEIQALGPSFLHQLIHPEDLAFFEEHFQQLAALSDGEIREIDYRLKDSTGGWHWINSRDTVFTRDEQQRPIQILSTAQDITERRRVQDRLWYLSTHDQLTGLYNRGYFHEEMTRVEKTRAYPISILLADLDSLKRTNDRYGHIAGDELLRRAANCLRSCFRPGELIARVGGDEFAILLERTSTATAASVLERIRRVVQAESKSVPEPFLGMSIGAATASQPQALLDVYQQADSQMYADKINRKQTGSLRLRE